MFHVYGCTNKTVFSSNYHFKCEMWGEVLNNSFIFFPLLGNIFYLMEYREIFLTLLRKYDETRQPLSYLKDLVESTHLFLRMLERFCKGRKNLMVQVSPWIKFYVCINAIITSDVISGSGNSAEEEGETEKVSR